MKKALVFLLLICSTSTFASAFFDACEMLKLETDHPHTEVLSLTLFGQGESYEVCKIKAGYKSDIRVSGDLLAALNEGCQLDNKQIDLWSKSRAKQFHGHENELEIACR